MSIGDVSFRSRHVNKTTRTTEGDIVEVSWGLDGLHFATDVELFYLAAQVRNGGMCGVVSAEDLDGFVDLVGAVDVLNGDDSQRFVISRVAEGDPSSWDYRFAVDVGL